MEFECLALKDLSTPRKTSTLGLEEEEEEDGGHLEQKENICTERRKSPPLQSEATAPTLLLNRKGVPADLAHITPNKHTSLVEPWTPTANLKMLISAASPDIREREMRKVLFRPIENDGDRPASPCDVVEDTEAEDSCQFEAVEKEGDADKKPSRKQKSLGLLCKKFLALYPKHPQEQNPIWISLDEVALSLGVERRRIYDIVNVLESVTIVGRIAKNSYTWYGQQHLEAKLQELQQRGRQQGYHLQMEPPREGALMELPREGALRHQDDGVEGDTGNNSGNRKDKSLRIMSEKFVMLFLVSTMRTVTLDTAAKILIEESQDSLSHSKYKTKVRRLYDIANVLTSLGLIKKVQVHEERGRKPAFEWVGPVKFNHSANVGNTENMASITQHGATKPTAGQDVKKSKMARHSSLNITPACVSDQRQVSSAPCSPRPEHTGLPSKPMDYSKMTSNITTSQMPFGNSTDPHPGAALPPSSSSQPPLPSLQLEHRFTTSSSPHYFTYLPSLSQPSVVMLYRPEQVTEGQKSPRLECEEVRKRRWEEREEEETVAKKKGASGLEECSEVTTQKARYSQTVIPTQLSGKNVLDEGPGSGEPAQPAHYLYVPNNPGLASFNFILPAGQPPSSLALNSSGVPTVALPFLVLPSASISHYPLVASNLPPQCTDAHNQLSFRPSVMPPAHIVVGAVPYSVTAASEMRKSPAASPSTPEHSRLYESASGAPHSPSGLCQAVSIGTTEPLTPQTPKETTQSASKAFFQTPGTLGNVVSSVPAARKRGSAQRRLDVGHHPNS